MHKLADWVSWEVFRTRLTAPSTQRAVSQRLLTKNCESMPAFVTKTKCIITKGMKKKKGIQLMIVDAADKSRHYRSHHAPRDGFALDGV